MKIWNVELLVCENTRAYNGRQNYYIKNIYIVINITTLVLFQILARLSIKSKCIYDHLRSLLSAAFFME